jgi:hypothetical protein
MYKRWFAIIIGLLTGALVGLAVYAGSRLTGISLFVLCGTVAGGMSALVFYGYSRAVHLTELTVRIPHISDMTFAVTRTNEVVAWRLFVEASTRISVQPLAEGSGSLREALTSLYTLFQAVRAILLEAEPSRRASGAPTVESLAISMLNLQIRPFISKWHARLSEWEHAHRDTPESAWPDSATCRVELEDTRLGLVEYVRGLGILANVGDVDSLMAVPSSANAGLLRSPVRAAERYRPPTSDGVLRGSAER